MKRRHTSMLLALTLACAWHTSSASATVIGPDFFEDDIGDAGSLPGSALALTGVGQAGRIRGSLSLVGPGVPDFEDMYLINITDAVIFRAQTVTPDEPGVGFDTQLWLFNALLEQDEGTGILANNDAPPGLGFPGSSLLLNASDDGTGVFLKPGLYFLAISGLGNVPLSPSGEIFQFNPNAPSEISGPDGVGAMEPINAWSGPGEVGDYTIELEGVTFLPLPTPGTLLIVAGAIGFGGRRRTRSRV